MAARLDICLQRNEDWDPVLLFIWPDTQEPIDLTGCTVAMQVRERLDGGGDAPIASATCTISDATAGKVDVLLLGSSGPLASYGNPIQTANLVHDMRVTDPDGVQVIVFSGTLILLRGVTQ